ncbi:MAG: hypothetical protein AVDCRST_MAG93-4894, partial [uncultured Chloroflexia bacterium]
PSTPWPASTPGCCGSTPPAACGPCGWTIRARLASSMPAGPCCSAIRRWPWAACRSHAAHEP